MNTKIKDTLAMKRFLNFLSNFWLKRYFRMTFDSNITTCRKYMACTRNRGCEGILIQSKTHVNLLYVKIGSTYYKNSN